MAILQAISFRHSGVGAAGRAGFTLLEILIAVGLFSLVMAGSFGVYIMCQRMWHAAALSMDTSRMANLAIQRMVYGLGTNSGLRSATASISVDTNQHNAVSSNYWDTTTNSPPAAGNAANDLVAGSPDGSWRLVYSNSFEGVKYIDYAKGQRSIVMWPDTNQTASRLLICNYVSSATVSSTNGAVAIQLMVWRKDGRFVCSNQVSAFITVRN